MSFVKKTWKDTVAEYPTRRILHNVSTNTDEIVTVSRSIGTVTQEGDVFNAPTMNDLETRIETGFANLKDNGKPFKFGYDPVTGRYGYYKDGADTVTPFNQDLEIDYSWSGRANEDTHNDMVINNTGWSKADITAYAAGIGGTIYGIKINGTNYTQITSDIDISSADTIVIKANDNGNRCGYGSATIKLHN